MGVDAFISEGVGRSIRQPLTISYRMYHTGGLYPVCRWQHELNCVHNDHGETYIEYCPASYCIISRMPDHSF